MSPRNEMHFLAPRATDKRRGGGHRFIAHHDVGVGIKLPNQPRSSCITRAPAIRNGGGIACGEAIKQWWRPIHRGSRQWLEAWPMQHQLGASAGSGGEGANHRAGIMPCRNERLWRCRRWRASAASSSSMAFTCDNVLSAPLSASIDISAAYNIDGRGAPDRRRRANIRGGGDATAPVNSAAATQA